MKLRIGTDSNGSLAIAAKTRGHPLAAIRFDVTGLAVRAASTDEVVLPWEQCCPALEVVDAPLRADGWAMICWPRSRTSGGIGLRISGRMAQQSQAIVTATMTLVRRSDVTEYPPSIGALLPIVLPTAAWHSFRKELATLAALCDVLAALPEFRVRLADRSRMRTLARRLDSGALLPAPYPWGGISRDAADVQGAMVLAGLRHRFGRPLPTDRLPSVADIADDIEARLRRNPYRPDKSVDRGVIERIVRADYLDINPWPFEALLS